MLDCFELAALPEAELPKRDVAETNLACAVGMPGAERVDIPLCLRTIDEMTGRVEQETRKQMFQFLAYPERFKYSEAYFRTLVMITVLQRDCGLRYNPDKVSDKAKFFAEDMFIFGLFQGRGGTCATLPVVYAAVGRRLGYPIKMVSCWQHLFARWDDPLTERFNIEATNQGLLCPPDEYYRKGSYELTTLLEKQEGYLLSLTPRRELAGFLFGRGVMWWNQGYCREAVECFAWAAELDGFPASQIHLQDSIREWAGRLKPLLPPQAPRFTFFFPPRSFALIHEKVERYIIELGAFEQFLTDPNHVDDWWEPMRRNPEYVPPSMPTSINIRFQGRQAFNNARERKVRLAHVRS